MNSIESFQTDRDALWKTVPLNDQIRKVYLLLLAVEYQNNILVFGGASLLGIRHTLLFNEEGELKTDLSSDPLIPGRMRQGPFMIKESKVLAKD